MTVILKFTPNSINRAGYLLNIGPPVFLDELEEILLTSISSKRSYNLPMISDPDDDAFELFIDLNIAFIFIKITQNDHLEFDYSKAT